MCSEDVMERVRKERFQEILLRGLIQGYRGSGRLPHDVLEDE